MWRGIGGFFLFLVSFTILGSIVGVLSVYLIASRFFSAPADGSLFEHVLRIVAGMASGYFGVIVGSYVLNAVMKGNYPARAIGATFVIFLASNFVLHFIFFPENTDFEIYAGSVSATVASVTAWFVFRLPPLAPQSR